MSYRLKYLLIENLKHIPASIEDSFTNDILFSSDKYCKNFRTYTRVILSSYEDCQSFRKYFNSYFYRTHTAELSKKEKFIDSDSTIPAFMKPHIKEVCGIKYKPVKICITRDDIDSIIAILEYFDIPTTWSKEEVPIKPIFKEEFRKDIQTLKWLKRWLFWNRKNITIWFEYYE